MQPATTQAGLRRDIKSKDGARAFFEQRFTPSSVVHNGRPGMLTGYYEPLLDGSRTPHGPYQTPIYKRPPDLVNVVPDTQRGAVPARSRYVRKTDKGTEPYFTRAQIDEGALKGKGLELLYLADSVDIFFLQIQGSGRVKLTDGSIVRVHYDGKNGHPYRSIGRYLIEKALLAADKVSMGALVGWLKADAERAKKVMWHNESYVFFRELKSSDDLGAPLGALKVPLTAGRSLALDPSYHCPRHAHLRQRSDPEASLPKPAPFNRLMIGQDVGSAIRGPERGDIYVGSGDAAGKLAGVTKHAGRFFVLVPKDAVAKTEAAAGKGRRRSQRRRNEQGRQVRPRRPNHCPRRSRLVEPAGGLRRQGQNQAAGDPARREQRSPSRCRRGVVAEPPKARRRVRLLLPSLAASRSRRAARHRLPSSTAAPRARWRPARPPSTRASTCTACASATPARSCSPSCGQARSRGARPCSSSPARATRRPAIAIIWPMPWASRSAACCVASCRNGWQSPSCAPWCSASPPPACATAAAARSTCSCAGAAAEA